MALVGAKEFEALGDAEQPVDLLRPVDVADALLVGRVAAGPLVHAAAAEEERARRGERKNLVMVPLESGALRIRVQKAPDGPAQFRDRIILGVDVRKDAF